MYKITLNPKPYKKSNASKCLSLNVQWVFALAEGVVHLSLEVTLYSFLKPQNPSLAIEPLAKQ